MDAREGPTQLRLPTAEYIVGHCGILLSLPVATLAHTQLKPELDLNDSIGVTGRPLHDW